MRLIPLCLSVALLSCTPISLARGEDAPKPTTVRVFDDATLTVPAAFKPTEAKSRIIEHEFEVQHESKTARLTMMAAGGDVQANVDRWKGQFAGGKADEQKSEQFAAGEWTVHLAELSGTYKDSMGGGPFFGGKTVEKPDHAMLGAILVHPEGRKYFVKLVGPTAVVKANREPFVQMIKSIKK